MSAPDRNESALAEGLKTAADASTPRGIDVEAVLGASRAKRRARRTAVVGGAGAVVAVLAVGGLVFGLQGAGLFGSTGADSSLESGAVAESVPDAADDSGREQAFDPQAANGGGDQCGVAVEPVTGDPAVPLSVRFVVPANVDPGASVVAEVIVTNDGDATVSGTMRTTPGIAVDEADVVVWHTRASDEAATPFELGPGESLTLPGSFETRRCDRDDEPLAEAATELPPLAAGTYSARAVVELDLSDSGASVVLVSPTADFTVD